MFMSPIRKTLRQRQISGGAARHPVRLAAFGLLAVLANAALSAQNSATAVYDRVILGGRVMDPASGLDAIRNVGVLDGRIAVITTEAVRGRDTIDARGLVVCPGFIDLHAHGQTPETYRFQSLDGVTTSLELEWGSSDVAAWYDERRAGERINYGVSIGHIKVRMSVMRDSGSVMPVGDGAYRAASAAEISEIARRIESGLLQGAVSIGAGLTYTPAATRDELLAVFRVAATTKTPVHVHARPAYRKPDERTHHTEKRGSRTVSESSSRPRRRTKNSAHPELQTNGLTDWRLHSNNKPRGDDVGCSRP